MKDEDFLNYVRNNLDISFKNHPVIHKCYRFEAKLIIDNQVFNYCDDVYPLSGEYDKSMRISVINTDNARIEYEELKKEHTENAIYKISRMIVEHSRRTK